MFTGGRGKINFVSTTKLYFSWSLFFTLLYLKKQLSIKKKLFSSNTDDFTFNYKYSIYI